MYRKRFFLMVFLFLFVSLMVCGEPGFTFAANSPYDLIGTSWAHNKIDVEITIEDVFFDAEESCYIVIYGIRVDGSDQAEDELQGSRTTLAKMNAHLTKYHRAEGTKKIR